MKTSKLSTLAKRYDLKEEIDYFDYCYDSYVNGNFSQCRELFAKMRKDDRKGLLNYIQSRNLSSSKEVYMFYFNLL